MGQGKNPKLRVFLAFSHIRMKVYFRLGKVRVNECPAGLEPQSGARNKRKSTVKIRKKRHFGFFL